MKNFFKRLTPADIAELICFILFIINTILHFVTKEYRLAFSTIISILWLLIASFNRIENDNLRKEIKILQKKLEEK